MPLLTVRLTDEDYAALKELAGGSSMAELVRAWITGGEDDVAVWATRDRAEAAEARVRELEAEVKRLKRELAGRAPVRAEGSFGAIAVVQGIGKNRAAVDEALGRFGAPRPAPKPGTSKKR